MLTNASPVTSPSTAPSMLASFSFSDRSRSLMERRGIAAGEQQEFADIMARAQTAGAGSDPKAFLNSLSSADMELLRRVHCLADPIRTAALDFEGAYNLLLAPGEGKDLDNDGLLSIGAARMWQYPPPNAPAAVHRAWEEATAAIPESEQWLMMAPFMAASAGANLKPDKSGFYMPGEPGYRNIYADPSFSYSRQVSDIIGMMKQLGGRSGGSYPETMQFLTSFLETLTRHQAA